MAAAFAHSSAVHSPAIHSNDSQWYADWFDSDHYHRLYAHRDDREAESFVDRLVRFLRPTKRAHVLDLGCGAGRHARQLASRGLNVTGIDLAANSIWQATRLERAGLRFLRQDMRIPFGRNTFHHVFNFFTSFGYFAAHEHRAIVHNMANALRSGGSLVLDYLNVHFAETNLVPEERKEIGGFAYHLTRWSDRSHFFKRILIEEESRQSYEYVERVAKLRLVHFQELFAQAGLMLQHAFGDYQLRPYDAGASPRLILIARKPA
jgi:SAM-dependent methyltransferase